MREIEVPLTKQLTFLGISDIPGQKICSSCQKHLSTLGISQHVRATTDRSDDDNLFEYAVDHEVLLISEKDSLNTTLSELHSKLKHGKRKLQQLSYALSKKVVTVLDIDVVELKEDDKQCPSTAKTNE